MKIVLHGILAEKFNNEFDLDVRNPRDALGMLINLVPGFKTEISKGYYGIVIGEIDDEDKRFLDIDELHHNVDTVINIIPELHLASSEGKGWTRTVLGIVLIVIGAILSFYTGYDWGLFAAGISLIVGGVSMILAPKLKKAEKDPDKLQSYLIDGPDSTIENGSPVPLVYGECLAGGGIISFELAEEMTNYYDPTLGSGGTGPGGDGTGYSGGDVNYNGTFNHGEWTQYPYQDYDEPTYDPVIF